MGQVGQGDIALFALTLLIVLGCLVAYFFVTYWKAGLKRGVSPYTGMPLRHAIELPYTAKNQVRQKYCKNFSLSDFFMICSDFPRL